MKERDFDARRLDVRAFAKAGGELVGEWPVAGFERLREALAEPVAGPAREPVRWSAQGVELAVHGGAPQVWLHLRAEAALPLVCQRCLKPCMHSVQFDRQFLFAPDEAAAARLDAEVDHDVLELTRELDLHELLEDELLLDLPLVPRHEACPEPLPAAAEEPATGERENPFAVLAALRRRQP